MTVSFGAVVPAGRSGRDWADVVRRLEQQGYDAVLVPDTLWTPSPFPALAAAAAVTSRLHVVSWVLAAPTRTPPAVVREASALQVLSDGRFELGIGAGRPDAEAETVRLGGRWGTPGERVAAVERVLKAVREEVTPVPPIVVAAAGPRLLGVVGRLADRVALALQPQSGADDLEAAVRRVSAAAEGRRLDLTLQLVAAGGRSVPWLAERGLTAQALADAGAVAMLTGDAGEMAEQVVSLGERYGITHLAVPGDLADVVAPVAARLRG
ncbi:MAG: LLM class flavin-dependent oxidoreductase [Actinomycetes bacterium]